MKAAVVILCIVSLGLGLTLMVQHRKSSERIQTVEADRTRMSAERDAALTKLKENQEVAARLEKDLNTRSTELTALSANLTEAKDQISKGTAEIAKVSADYKSAMDEVKKQGTRITVLEGERDELARKMEDLNRSIGSLETQIADTKKKLANSEGDRTFLLAQLKKLEGERAQLQAQFNDLSTLRKQIAKLKDEAAVSQRLAWMRSGLYENSDKRGAELLLANPKKTNDKPNNDKVLIEVDQSGKARIVNPDSDAGKK